MTDGNEHEYPSTLSIAVSDVDGDGRVDMLIGNHDNQNQVLLNKEKFGYVEVSNAFAGDQSETRVIAVADLNGDGLPDLVIGNMDKPNQVLLNQGESFREVFSDVSADASLTLSVAVGDLNGDGLPDIIIGNIGPNQVLWNKGDGKFEESDVNLPGRATRVLALADVNADGHLDIIIGNTREPIRLMLNQGDGTFQESIDAIPGDYDEDARDYDSVTTITVADMNNDGFIDIVIGDVKEEPNQLLLNQGDGTFQEIEGGRYTRFSMVPYL